MNGSRIEWTETTWNPTTGCTKISSGCKNCYAERMTKRLNSTGLDKYRNGFRPAVHEETLKEPYSWRKPRVVFVDSMSDLFHEDIPTGFIQKVFKVMNENPRHIFQVLTKRSERLEELTSIINWSENIWAGVTVEDDRSLYGIDDLRKCGADVKFI